VRRIAKKKAEEDATPLAGWMYADLLLALMVIFLATISFVPNILTTAQSSPSANAQSSLIKKINSGYNYNLGLSFIYKNFDFSTLQQDIAQFEAKNGLPADSEIIYAQILGGFDHRTESSNTGKIRALEFSVKLSKSYPDLLKNAATNIGTSLLLTPNEVAVRFTLVSKLG
jgi:biopolymer transport protein ExbD